MTKNVWRYDAKEKSYSAQFPRSEVLIEVTCDGSAKFYCEDGRETPPETCEYLPLIEGGTYHYQLSDTVRRLDIRSSFMGGRAPVSSKGGIQPGTAVGFGRLWLAGQCEPDKALGMEVASKVINYKDHYQTFLEEITDRVAALQMYSRGMTFSRWTPAVRDEKYKSREARVREMFFIIGLVANRKFQNAVKRIMANPHTVLRDVEEDRDIRMTMRFGRKALTEIASATRRVPYDAPEISSLPERLHAVHREETCDTRENRFVKHVLVYFKDKLEKFRQQLVEGALDKNGDSKFDKMAISVHLEGALEMLRGLSGQAFFRDIGKLTSMPYGSTVLQRREGYRDVLKKWIQFHTAAKLGEEDIDDIFCANQRNMATLYEYWCFFRLLDIVRDCFHVTDTSCVAEMISEATDGISFSLKRNQHLKLEGTFERVVGRSEYRYRGLNIGYYYNRTFSPDEKDKKKRKSWTFQMKPDYTLAFYPEHMSEKDAVAADLITYVHFDAKYKVLEIEQSIREIERGDSEESGNDPACKSTGDIKSEKDVKHVDVLKMHAYRDAVYQTGGAYVLYPGDADLRHDWQMYEDEILPAIGAFPMSPSTANESAKDIAKLLITISEHLCDKITKWEDYQKQISKIYHGRKFGETDGDLVRIPHEPGLCEAFIVSGFAVYSTLNGIVAPKGIHWIETRNDAGEPVLFRVVAYQRVLNVTTIKRDYHAFQNVDLGPDSTQVFYVWSVKRK